MFFQHLGLQTQKFLNKFISLKFSLILGKTTAKGKGFQNTLTREPTIVWMSPSAAFICIALIFFSCHKISKFHTVIMSFSSKSKKKKIGANLFVVCNFFIHQKILHTMFFFFKSCVYTCFLLESFEKMLYSFL